MHFKGSDGYVSKPPKIIVNVLLASSDLSALRDIVDTPITGPLEYQMKYGDTYIQVGSYRRNFKYNY